MNTTKPHGKSGLYFICTMFSVFLFSGCNTTSQSVPTSTGMPKTLIPVFTSTPTRLPGPWQIVGIYNENQSIMTAGFLDELHVATGGILGQMAYSSDGAETWLQTDAHADCRYGIEIVSPEVI